jgi:prepilin signal peptidase PulO-like enzyme (type II secretory pathway)
MDALILLWFFILGTIIGSFLNVVIYRFNTGKSLNGRSHCLSCGGLLSWYELLPVVSYVVQKGACRSCSARITPRYLYVELLTGLLFLFCAHLFLSDPVLLLFNLAITSLLVVILVYDLRHTIIPDELVLYLLVLAIAYTLWDQLLQTITLTSPERILGAVIPAALFGGLWYLSRGRWIGLGDAKLAVPLGLILGIAGSVSMFMLAFWIGAGVSVSGIVLQKLLHGSFVRNIRRGQISLLFLGGPLTMRSEVPFAPFLICAFFLVHLVHVDAFALIDAAIALFFV